jgi:hypothetical protein
MPHETLARLEADLRRIQGVQSARVVGDEEPTEIHVVSSPGRPAKQVVRDVQSLAAARFGLPIDHRIVSVVQLDQKPAAAAAQRPVLDRVVVANKGDSGWVKVVLVWPDGRTTEGAGSVGATRVTRARGATSALVQALEPVIGERRRRLDVDHVMIYRIGSGDSVVVRAAWQESGSSAELIGSALVYDDVASAAVQALLQAVNRKLESP